MKFIRPVLPPFDPSTWLQSPFPERAKAVCASWATDGYGTPAVVFVAYGLKILAYVWVWSLFCSLSPSLGPLSAIASWWAEPLALQKAILWSMLFEVLGLGCGSGPLTGRYRPPVGAPLYFLRRGTIRLPPLGAGRRRGMLDVLLYAALLAALLAVLTSPAVTTLGVLPVVVLLVLSGLRDRTIFLAARSEHYLVACLIFLLAGSTEAFVAGLMALWAALWFFAGFSKLNSHFAPVVCVMVSNSPMLCFAGLRKRMYRSYPDDLRPSGLAIALGHFGTALELSIPLVLLTAWSPGMLLLGMALVVLLHGYITTSVPVGVPLEWNVLVAYGAFVLFWGHPEVSVLQMSAPIAVLVLTTAVVVPLLGNLFPGRISFLPSMRYYAGNWAMSVWLFRGDSHKKLYRSLTMPSPWVREQLGPFYDDATITALLSRLMAFRLMHLHGRALGELLPQALGEAPLSAYTWMDGEVIAGAVLGWNFGDGHLHGARLIEVIRAECDFAPGELRCITVEAQPLLQRHQRYEIFDGADGLIGSGMLPVAALRERQPWDQR